MPQPQRNGKVPAGPIRHPRITGIEHLTTLVALQVYEHFQREEPGTVEGIASHLTEDAAEKLLGPKQARMLRDRLETESKRESGHYTEGA